MLSSDFHCKENDWTTGVALLHQILSETGRQPGGNHSEDSDGFRWRCHELHKIRKRCNRFNDGRTSVDSEPRSDRTSRSHCQDECSGDAGPSCDYSKKCGREGHQNFFSIFHSGRRLGHEGRPRWSRGNVLASRSKVRGFKPSWGRWTFSGRKNPE